MPFCGIAEWTARAPPWTTRASPRRTAGMAHSVPPAARAALSAEPVAPAWRGHPSCARGAAGAEKKATASDRRSTTAGAAARAAAPAGALDAGRRQQWSAARGARLGAGRATPRLALASRPPPVLTRLGAHLVVPMSKLALEAVRARAPGHPVLAHDRLVADRVLDNVDVRFGLGGHGRRQGHAASARRRLRG
eukprot:scaffold18648_cov124-Isochrysis_galbana.AAC.4